MNAKTLELIPTAADMAARDKNRESFLRVAATYLVEADVVAGVDVGDRAAAVETMLERVSNLEGEAIALELRNRTLDDLAQLTTAVVAFGIQVLGRETVEDAGLVLEDVSGTRDEIERCGAMLGTLAEVFHRIKPVGNTRQDDAMRDLARDLPQKANGAAAEDKPQ